MRSALREPQGTYSFGALFGVPYGNRTRVAAGKEKRFAGIQRKPAAWIHGEVVKGTLRTQPIHVTQRELHLFLFVYKERLTNEIRSVACLHSRLKRVAPMIYLLWFFGTATVTALLTELPLVSLHVIVMV